MGYATTHALTYAPLPCSQSSAGWKELGTCVVRGILRDTLSARGFYRRKEDRKIGLGPPPVGCDIDIELSNCKGTTRSDCNPNT